jgi:hypothetical protein
LLFGFRMQRSIRHYLSAGLVWVWALGLLVPVSALMASHLLTLPLPERSTLVSGLSKQGQAQWRAFHVIAEKCACSVKVLEGLVGRGVRPGVVEKVLFIGSEGSAWKKDLSAKGFEFEVVTMETLATQFGIEGAPLFVVLNPQGDVVYSGGYSKRKQGESEDITILNAALANADVTALPLFGCAVSRDLQKKLDPLGLKYVEKE